jgi:ankyrin repeat protein
MNPRGTPLHEAAFWAHLDVVALLLRHGADVCVPKLPFPINPERLYTYIQQHHPSSHASNFAAEQGCESRLHAASFIAPRPLFGMHEATHPGATTLHSLSLINISFDCICLVMIGQAQNAGVS